MATEPRTIIEIPELNQPNHYNRQQIDAAQLELSTYSGNGRIWSNASVTFKQLDGGITCMLGSDYMKHFPAVRGVRATQKALDTHHAKQFTPENIETIKGDVLAFYRAKHSRAIDAILSNDEASTDEQLLAHLLSEGVPEGIAKGAIANRTTYLKQPVPADDPIDDFNYVGSRHHY